MPGRPGSAAPTPVELPVLEPMLASPGTMPSDPDEWLFEVKWDGMRLLSSHDGAGGLRLLSRNGNSATERFPELGELARLLPGRDLILDGEAIAPDDQGRPSFGRLQQRMTLRGAPAIRRATYTVPVSLMVFDLLWLDGASLVDLPYAERRALLEELDLGGAHVHVPPAWPGSMAAEAARWTRERGMEGLVAKRLGSRYRPGVRSPEWVKIKYARALDVVVGGWVPGGPRGTAVKSLLVGVVDPSGLRYVGAVGTGFAEAERRALAGLLHGLECPVSPFSGPPAGLDRGESVRFVRPDLQAEVGYAEFTDRGLLRQPVWRGLRGDIGP